MANRSYNQKLHITAGELRRLGFYVSEMLADEAFVRRVAVGFNAREAIDDGTATLGLRIFEPFVTPVTRAEELAYAI